jgi:ornithine cyclodeaminase/alanine dehydrogenase-like protein (mu-crystallin family)
MQYIDATTVRARLATEPLLEALERMFVEGCTVPVRHAHSIAVPDAPDGSLLLMPAWRSGHYLGTKLVSVYPGNSGRNLPAVAAIYILFDAQTGIPLSILDGDELTARRTAATSALAARYMARPHASHLLIVGSGRIARELAVTHRAARPGLERISIWSRSSERADALAHRLRAEGLPATPVTDLAAAAATADLISAATLSTEPLLQREWIRPGTHIDLVGAFRPGMREADDALVAASHVVCDTRAGVLAEADDVRVPLEKGLLSATQVHELAELCRGEVIGRAADADITLFKSVGAGLEDLAAATVVYGACRAS